MYFLTNLTSPIDTYVGPLERTSASIASGKLVKKYSYRGNGVVGTGYWAGT